MTGAGVPEPEWPEETVFGLGPCAGCGHDPACGFSSAWSAADGERWFCHTDDHSCYVDATVLSGSAASYAIQVIQNDPLGPGAQ